MDKKNMLNLKLSSWRDRIPDKKKTRLLKGGALLSLKAKR
jgi:hypothetical protein